ncbi:MAG: hypothetical protein SynsKO_16850 [Synoicihabitans sp.]
MMKRTAQYPSEPTPTLVPKLNHDDFLRLFTQSEPNVRAFIRRLVANCNDASEISQNTAIVLWDKFDSFVERNADYQSGKASKTELELHFTKWAMKVARFEVLSWRRDKARDRHLFSPDFLETLADKSEEIDERLERQRSALKRCLGKLPESRRELIMEAYSARNKPQEIASRTGKSTNAFYQWMHRVRLSLLKCAKKDLNEEAYS